MRRPRVYTLANARSPRRQPEWMLEWNAKSQLFVQITQDLERFLQLDLIVQHNTPQRLPVPQCLVSVYGVALHEALEYQAALKEARLPFPDLPAWWVENFSDDDIPALTHRLYEATFNEACPWNAREEGRNFVASPTLCRIRTHLEDSPLRSAYVTKYVDYSPVARIYQADMSENGYSPIATLRLDIPLKYHLLQEQQRHQPCDAPVNEDVNRSVSDFITKEQGYSPIDHKNMPDDSEAGYSPISCLLLPKAADAEQNNREFLSMHSESFPPVTDSPTQSSQELEISHFERVLSQELHSSRSESSALSEDMLHLMNEDYSPIERICRGSANRLRACNGTCLTPGSCGACVAWNIAQIASEDVDAVKAARDAEIMRPSYACPVHVSTQKRSTPCGRCEQLGPLDMGVLLKTSAQDMWMQIRSCMRVGEMKQKVWELTGLKPSQQCLFLEQDGRLLHDEYAMYDYNVLNGCTILLTTK